MDRKAHPQDKKDVLNTMLFGVDPKTGEKLSDENIVNNVCIDCIIHLPYPH